MKAFIRRQLAQKGNCRTLNLFRLAQATLVLMGLQARLAGTYYTHVHLDLQLKALTIQGVAMHKILDTHDKDKGAVILLLAGFNDSAVVQLDYASGQTLADVLHQYTLKGHLDVTAVTAVHRNSVKKFKTRLHRLIKLFQARTRTKADHILDRDELDKPLQAFIEQGRRGETQESCQK